MTDQAHCSNLISAICAQLEEFGAMSFGYAKKLQHRDLLHYLDGSHNLPFGFVFKGNLAKHQLKIPRLPKGIVISSEDSNDEDSESESNDSNDEDSKSESNNSNYENSKSESNNIIDLTKLESEDEKMDSDVATAELESEDEQANTKKQARRHDLGDMDKEDE